MSPRLVRVAAFVLFPLLTASIARAAQPEVAWLVPLGGAAEQRGNAIAIAPNGDVIVAGSTSSIAFAPGATPIGLLGGQDVFVARLHADGPSLVWITLLGGSGDDVANALAVAADGSVTVVGSTSSSDFPTLHARQPAPGGASDAFVARLEPDGAALRWSTYLGGSGDDQALGVALDAAANAYVTGWTNALDFPTQAPFQASLSGNVDCAAFPFGEIQHCGDAFVTKIAADGSDWLYSTYLGGQSHDVGTGIAVDAQGAVVVAGSARSLDFPIEAALQPVHTTTIFCYSQFNEQPCSDVFVTKLAPDGQSLVFSTYLGALFSDGASAVALHPSGAIFVTGEASFDFPLVNPADATREGYDEGFAAAFTPDGQTLLYSTFLGGAAEDLPNGIAVDVAGTATIVGQTSSTDFPVAPSGGGFDAFAVQLSASGALATGVRLGGAADERAHGVALDRGGNFLVVGDGAPAASPSAADAFVARFLLPVDDLACDVALAAAAYGNGDSVAASTLRFANAGPLARAVRLRLALAPPAGASIDALDIGAAGDVLLPPDFDSDVAPASLFAVSPGLPRGTWTLRCELADPASGTVLASDAATFEVR